MTTPVITANQNTIFLPLQKLNYAQFSGLTVRKLETTWPTTVFDNNAYPTRKLSLWPVPQGSMAIELWLWEPLNTYASLDDELDMPPGYERYYILKLAMELAPEFGKQVTDTLKAAAIEAEQNIKVINQVPAYGQPTAQGRSLWKRTSPYTYSDGHGNRIPRGSY